MRNKMRSVLGYSLAVVAIALLAGCWGKPKEEAAVEGGVPLLKINNKPVINDTAFYKELGAMVGKMDPMLLPKPTQRKVLEDLARFETTVAAAIKEGVDKDPEFRKAYKEQKRRLKKVALVRFYDKKKFDEIKVDEVAAKAHFDANKASYVKEQGGVLVSGVKFSSREKALAFYENAKKQTKVEDFASIGKKEKEGKFREFGRVGEEAAQGAYNMVPAAIKSAALKLTKVPGVDIVKDGKETWIIHVSDKKEAVLYEYPEIKERLINQLKINEFMKQRNEMYEKLKKELNVEINEEFFKEVPGVPSDGAEPGVTVVPAGAAKKEPKGATSVKVDKESM